jgi:hypothetical protein
VKVKRRNLKEKKNMHARDKPKLHPNLKTHTYKHTYTNMRTVLYLLHTHKEQKKELSFNTVRKLSVDSVVVLDCCDYEMENVHH